MLFSLSARRLGCVLGAVALLASSCKKEDGGTATVTPTPTPPVATPVASQVALWLTNSDRSVLFAPQNVALNFAAPASPAANTIVVDTTQTYQSIDGFGFTLTGASAYVIHQLSATNRAALLKELFSTDDAGLGISYLRISIGASDLDAKVFSYDDSPTGAPDPTLANFSLAPDRADLLPVLKEILAINPSLKILGSPWSAPVWMKLAPNKDVPTKGGTLNPLYYDAYAQYFVRYLQGMAAEGVTLDAVTLQNEPLNAGNNPSMYMGAADQTRFIKDYVGPAFRAAGLKTKIICYDHNLDHFDYPLSVLSNADANAYVDGSAFHLYAGDIQDLSQVHAAYPTKNVYFTEQYVGAPGDFGADVSWAVNNLIIGATRHWSRNVLEWNLAADPTNGPHTGDGGCSTCQPAVTISTTGQGVLARNASYYIIAHASKFVRPGSVRVDTNQPGSLLNVAFKTPAGKRVLIVLNNGSVLQNFAIQYKGQVINTSLYGKCVGTYVW